MTLGELVSTYRKEHGLSQRQFALACDLSNGYVSMLEKGANPKTGVPLTPSLPVLNKLASGMKMTTQELFLTVDDMPLELVSDDATGHEKQLTTESDNELLELVSIFSQLSADNRSKLLELSHLYLDAQRKSE